MICIRTIGASRPSPLRFAALVLVCVLAMTGQLPAATGSQECNLKRIGSVNLTAVNDRIAVSVTVNGHPARMLLDVSDIATTIGGQYTQSLGLKVHPLLPGAAVNFGDTRITQSAALATFAVGSVPFSKADFFVFPSSRPPSTDTEPIIGQLGMDVLGNLDFELDFANGKLNFYLHDHCPGAVVYWTNTYSSAPMTRGPLGNYYFPIELEGKKVEASISTVNPGTSLPTEVTRRLYGFDEKSAGIETETSTAGGAVAHYRAMALTGNGLSVKNARIELRTSPPGSHCSLTTMGGPARYEGCMGGEPPLLLGLNVARHLHLYFATKEHVLYFSDAAASK